ncbi:hypothetical protein XH98_14760 [Bradyrhizobium sp. CCBAU 51745]|uniref:hypothetical protein n=1 Tax=Bradyrhizobium sp. CCBAU 51745 TaxID=1325099 RepID=UPI002305B125|nr:hypothetical protein [Bradyrhizobium sp. CCBAU 51745]MDA9440357.1 hypothetical protein [Bradyrhizobium sp. CCBAU 51745]
MDSYVAHANIDHYFNLLTVEGITDRNRDTIVKLMIAEEDKLGRDLETLQFAEDRAARGRDRLNHLRRLRAAFADGSIEQARADQMLANFETTQKLMEQFCLAMRERAHSNRISRF